MKRVASNFQLCILCIALDSASCTQSCYLHINQTCFLQSLQCKLKVSHVLIADISFREGEGRFRTTPQFRTACSDSSTKVSGAKEHNHHQDRGRGSSRHGRCCHPCCFPGYKGGAQPGNIFLKQVYKYTTRGCPAVKSGKNKING